MKKDYYAELGLTKNASMLEINDAYNKVNKEGNELIREAYDVLSNPQKREDYDNRQKYNEVNENIIAKEQNQKQAINLQPEYNETVNSAIKEQRQNQWFNPKPKPEPSADQASKTQKVVVVDTSKPKEEQLVTVELPTPMAKKPSPFK
jgi:curved DNA-binding protein CbpA